IKVSQHGRSGSVHLGSVSAGGSSGGSLHAAVHITTTDTSTGGGSGNISAATITATGGGVLIQANAGSNSGGNIHALVITGPSISLNATAKKGGDISVGALHATGTGGISLYGHATGGVSSSGGRITVNGAITASRGAVKVDALGGLDSGGHINVHGSINAAGDVKLLAVGLGSCCDGNISISGSITGNFIDIESRNTNATATSGATIRINGSVKATGTAPSASPNLGVTIDAGSSHARHGAPQITVTGNITASHAAVNLNLWGSASGGRSIAVGQSVAGVWTNGAIKAQRVNIQAHGSAGGAAVTTGNITAAGKVSIVADGKGRSGVGIKVGSVTAQSVSFSGSDKLGGAASLIAGKIAATKLNVSATANAATGQVATISLGSIHGVNASGGASIDLNAVGGTTSLTLGPIAVGGSLTVKSKGALDLSSATLQAGKDMTLQAGGIVTLTSAHVQAGGQVTLLAGQHILLGLTKVKAGGAFSADAHGSISDGGSGGSITAAGATFKAATGKVRLDGETLNIGTSKLAFSAAGSVALNNAHIHAGSMTVAAVGNLNMTSASIHAAGMQVVTGGSIDLSGDTMVVTGAVKLTAGLVAANQPLAAKDIVLSGVTITVGTLSADAGGTIHNGGAVGTITANGLALTAGKDITLSSTQITVGNGSVASLGSDPLLLQALATVGLSPASPRPNAYFNAGGTLTLGKFTLNGDYLYMQAANITLLGPVTAPTNSVIQFAPTTGPASIGVEQTPGTGSVLNLSNSLLLSLFPGTTLVIGNGTESGAVTLGSSGPIDIGSSNLIVETSGTVTGLSNVISTGLVSTVQSLLASVLPPPTPSEIDPNSSNNNNTAGKHRQQGDYDPDGGGTGGGTITQTTDTGGACH
ncbi:MAG TPA: hypothetical protein VLV87_08720, partial [Gammaproteobacteria bacterium]|nr:hypothetical protein [Gammaproteobacteria bacterium]